MKIVRACLLLPLALCLSCPVPQVIERPVARLAGDSEAHRAAMAEAWRLWAERLDEQKLRGALAAWRRAIALADDDVDSYTMAARASFLLADAFLAQDPARREEMKRTFEDGAALADRGLRALSPEFERGRQAGGDVDEAAVGLGKEAAPLLYWWGVCAISWANAEGWSASVRLYKHVFAAIEKVRQLDPGYDRAGADRFFGGARAESPAIAGGDLKKSREHFERAMAIAPDCLETRLQLARHYARKAHDDQLYADTLRFIAEEPASQPEDELTKRKASRLSARR